MKVRLKSPLNDWCVSKTSIFGVTIEIRQLILPLQPLMGHLQTHLKLQISLSVGKRKKIKRIYKSKSFQSTTEFFWMLRSIKQDQYCMENCLCSFASLCFLMHDELLLSVLSIKGYERWIEFLPRQWNQRRTKQRKADIDYWNSEILH